MYPSIRLTWSLAKLVVAHAPQYPVSLPSPPRLPLSFAFQGVVS